MSFDNFTLDFGSSIIDEAIEVIESERLNIIHCSLTGSEVGTINQAEVRLCLQIEMNRKPLSSVDDLVDSFAMRHYAMSSGPAPSLRVHKDHNTLVRILRLDKNGPNRLLAYLLGRLFFESVMPQRDIGSTDLGMAKLGFLMGLHERLARLPNWHTSLTADDEDAKSSDNAVGLLTVVGKLDDTSSEAKAAQRCLEILLRLDAIHNLRTVFYNDSLRKRMAKACDTDSWSFLTLYRLLDELESDGIIRLQNQRPIGNAMAITAALDSIAWANRRVSRNMAGYIESIEKGDARGQYGTGTSGSTIIAMIHETLITKPNLSRKDELNLESALKQLKTAANSVGYSDKRLSVLHHIYGKAGERAGKHRVVHGDQTSKHLAESYLDKGQNVPAVLKAKLDALAKAGKVTKAQKKPGVKSALQLSLKEGLFGDKSLQGLLKKDVE